jgi:hypothetical protein
MAAIVGNYVGLSNTSHQYRVVLGITERRCVRLAVIASAPS